tara:strand:- start:244 stop:738 length:495 start_codon:yes stop_codon:yes gene_type:complete
MLRPQSEVEAKLREFDRQIEDAMERSRKAGERIAEARSRLSPEVRAFIEVSARGNKDERFLKQLADEDSPLLGRILEAARMPEAFGMRQFYKLVEKDMDYEEARCIERFFALCDMYLQYRTRQLYAQMDEPLAPDHWSGVGPVTYNAPASKGSVVDAVFAKLGA